MTIYKMSNLTSLNISNEWKHEGDRMFKNNNNELISLFLPTNLKEINGKSIEIKPLTSYKIPEGITSIGKYCFFGCKELTHIEFPKTIKETKKWSFYGINSQIIQEEPLLTYVKKHSGDNIISGITDEEIKQIEEWTQLTVLRT